MASGRETILARLLLIAQGTRGIRGAIRNAADDPDLKRPFIIIHDGTDVLVNSAAGTPASERLSRRQNRVLTPGIEILAYASEPDVGTLLNQCCERFISALISDAELLVALGIDPATATGSGEIRFDACVLEPAVAESKERRMVLTIVFTYPYQVASL
jgi:hypothetical protein